RSAAPGPRRLADEGDGGRASATDPRGEERPGGAGATRAREGRGGCRWRRRAAQRERGGAHGQAAAGADQGGEAVVSHVVQPPSGFPTAEALPIASDS